MVSRVFKSVHAVLLSWAFVAVAMMVIGPAQAAGVQVGGPAKVTSPGGYSSLATKAQRPGGVKVIVGANAPFSPEAVLSKTAFEAQRTAIVSAQDKVVSELQSAGLKPASHYKFKYVPYLAMTLDSASLNKLIASSNVLNIQEDVPDKAIEAIPWDVSLIGASDLQNIGVTGSGIAVAVLDTGVDKTHPYLSGAVVSEACYSSNDPTYSSTSICPGGVTESTAAGSAMPYTSGVCPEGECDHGTHVSGTVAGRAGVGGGSPGPGVAPEASIIAIQVFSVFPVGECGSGATSPCAKTFSSDQMKGLERVYDLRGTYTIASLNMSLGGGSSATNCDTDSRKPIIDLLRAAGIASAIASGNDHLCGYISYPACISTAVSVGATDSGDNVASFSNSASFLSLFAPGVSIVSSVPGDTYAEWNGTSMATPHVAGAWALMKQNHPTTSVTDILDAFTSTGTSVTDAGKCPSVTKKRINVYEAFNALGNNVQLTVVLAGNKKGVVSATGLVCSTKTKTCTGTYTAGTSVDITATANSGSFFDGWTNCTSPDGNVCHMTVNSATTVTATFNTPPKVFASPSSVNFGNVNISNPASKIVTVKNTGNSHLTISSAIISSGAVSGGTIGSGTLDPVSAEFEITDTSCVTTLAKNETCTITVIPAPASADSWGARTGLIVIESDDPKSPKTVKLTAKFAPPKISAPSTLNFGTVKIVAITPPTKTVRIKNTGTSDLLISNIVMRNSSPTLQLGDWSACGTLVKNAYCDVPVTFTPSDTIQVIDYLDITSNDPDLKKQPVATVTVKGKGK